MPAGVARLPSYAREPGIAARTSHLSMTLAGCGIDQLSDTGLACPRAWRVSPSWVTPWLRARLSWMGSQTAKKRSTYEKVGNTEAVPEEEDYLKWLRATTGWSLPTMDFRPREAPFFGDYFFRFGPIAFKFSHTSFQPKRRFLSIWSVNKKSIIRVVVIAS